MFKDSRLLPLAAILLMLTGCGRDPLEVAKDALEPLNLTHIASEGRLTETADVTTGLFLKAVDEHWSGGSLGLFQTRLEAARKTLDGEVDGDEPHAQRARAILAAMNTTQEIVAGYAERNALRGSTEAFGAYYALSAAGSDALMTKPFFNAYLEEEETRRLYAVASHSTLCDTYKKNRNRLTSDPVFQAQVDQFAASWFNQDTDAVLSRKRYGKRAYFSGVGVLPAYTPETGSFADAPATFMTISSENAARSIQGREAGTNFDMACTAGASGMACSTPYMALRSDLRGCPYPKQFRVYAELADPKGLLRDTRIELSPERARAEALAFVTRSEGTREISGYGLIVEAYTAPATALRIDKDKGEIVVSFDIEKVALFTQNADASHFLGLLSEPGTLHIR